MAKRNSRRALRKGVVARSKAVARRWGRGETVFGLCLLVSALWTSVQKHELDELRRHRLDLRAQLIAEEAAFEEARTAWSREASYDRIVARAQSELGFVDARPGERMMVALPRLETRSQQGIFARMADGLDRFAEVRQAMARDGER